MRSLVLATWIGVLYLAPNHMSGQDQVVPTQEGTAEVAHWAAEPSRPSQVDQVLSGQWEHQDSRHSRLSQLPPREPALWGSPEHCVCQACNIAHTDLCPPSLPFGARLFQHREPNHPERFLGKGQPLTGTSWRNRPLYASGFMGAMFADELVASTANPENGFFDGVRVGYDFDHYWGSEVRVGFSQLALRNSQSLSRELFADVHLLRYPWGDSRWRPYASVGLGLANVRFTDNQDTQFNEVLLHVPVGCGLKYFYKKWCALRIDVMDNIAIGKGGVSDLHNVSLTGGIEVHFGGWRRAYAPWNPSFHYW